MVQSNRSIDMKREQQVTKVLVDWLKREYNDKIEIKITNSKEEQDQGSDLIVKCKDIFDDDNDHVVDVKSATDYPCVLSDEKPQELHTFAMEIGSLQWNDQTKQREFVEGWAVTNDSYYFSKTEYYFFVWITVFKKIDDIYDERNIKNLELKVIKKSDLKEFITTFESEFGSINAESSKKLHEFFEKIAPIAKVENKEGIYTYESDSNPNKKFSVKYQKKYNSEQIRADAQKKLNPTKSGPKLIFTMSKVEKPLNITLHKGTILSKLAKKEKNLSFTNQ